MKNTFKPIVFGPFQQTKIWSPGKLQGNDYKRSTLCRYNVGCPPNSLMFYGWIDDNFNLEDEDVAEGCLDHLLLDTGFSTQLICGTQKEFSSETAGSLEVEFRSNTRNQFPGFQIDILCADSNDIIDAQSLELGGGFPGCIKVPDDITQGTRKVRTFQWWTFLNTYSFTKLIVQNQIQVAKN